MMGSAFDDIFGQDRAIETIRRAYTADRLPHGLIFAGPVGVGKATTVRALAKLFLCESPKQDNPCNKCESCRGIDAAAHPDFHVLTKELIRYHDKTGKSKGIDLSIHVIRPELIEPAARKPVRGRGKVFVIEQAELMNPQAQNAMLKTLEEPAGRTLIILLTDQPNSLLATIRSRCQTIRFAELDEALVCKELQKRGTDKTAAADAAALANGSLGVAMKWLEEGVVANAKQLIRQIDDLTSGKRSANLPDWFKKAADEYAAKQLERDELSSKDQATREGLAIYLGIAASHFRRVLAQTQDPDELERACSAIDWIARAELYLDANVNIPLTFQQLATSLQRDYSVNASSRM